MRDVRPPGKHLIAIDIRDDPSVVLSEDDDGVCGTSRYVKHSAHLPHLGDDADHEVVDEMENLRNVKVKRRRNTDY